MKISVQLYTLRDDMAKDPAGTLRAVGQMGYRFVETAGFAGRTAKEFAQMCRDAGVQPRSMHIGLDAFEKDLPKVLDDAAALEAKYLIVPGTPASAYAEGWDVLGVRLQAIGEKVAKAGRVFAYHNHAHEYVDVKGRPGLDILYESSCPDTVKAQLDLWWVYVGKHDPAKEIAKHGKRVCLVHLKDGDNVESHVQIEAGRGLQNWDAILKACRDADVEFGVVELDTCPRPPLESVKICLEFFRAKGFLE